MVLSLSYATDCLLPTESASRTRVFIFYDLLDLIIAHLMFLSFSTKVDAQHILRK